LETFPKPFQQDLSGKLTLPGKEDPFPSNTGGQESILPGKIESTLPGKEAFLKSFQIEEAGKASGQGQQGSLLKSMHACMPMLEL
jgi:hypothetical protein